MVGNGLLSVPEARIKYLKIYARPISVSVLIIFWFCKFLLSFCTKLCRIFSITDQAYSYDFFKNFGVDR